jgi:hypothetical protein
VTAAARGRDAKGQRDLVDAVKRIASLDVGEDALEDVRGHEDRRCERLPPRLGFPADRLASGLERQVPQLMDRGERPGADLALRVDDDRWDPSDASTRSPESARPEANRLA